MNREFSRRNICFLGRIWSWGDGKWGKLGRGTEESSDVPELIDCFGSVIRASCGFDFSVCLTEDGKVWTWYVCILCVVVKDIICIHNM